MFNSTETKKKMHDIFWEQKLQTLKIWFYFNKCNGDLIFLFKHKLYLVI